MNHVYVSVVTAHFVHGRSLFLQYAGMLNIDLCFQDLETELQQMYVQYNLPTGTLVLAY
ncbi:MAG: hypothetical protein ACKO96_34275 [Flammeovirgaceae bacterium]